MVVFGQIGCVRAKWLSSAKSSCIRAKLLYSGKSDCYRAKWLYLGKVVVDGKSGCNCAKVVLFGQ